MQLRRFVLFCHLGVFLSPLSAQTSNWQALAGPTGGTVHCIAQSNDAWYAGTGSGIFYSQDKGDTWQKSNWAPPDGTVSSIEIRPGEIIFNSATGDPNDPSSYNRLNTLFRSTDGGLSWISTDVGVNPFGGFGDIEVFRQGGALFASGQDQLLKSIDNGQSWATLDMGNILFNVVHHNDSLLLVQTTFDGAFYSKDGGDTWLSLAHPPDGFAFFSKYVPGKGNTIFYFGDYETSYRSSDFGTSWESIGTPFGYTQPFRCQVLPGGRLAALVDNPDDDEMIYLSDDEGLSWTEYTGSPYAPTLGVIAEADQLGVATAAGFYKNNNNSNTLHPSNAGLLAANVKRLVASGDQLLAVTGGRVWRSFDDGANWFQALPQDQLSGTLDLALKGDTLCALTEKNFFLSTDQGDTWTTLYDNISGGSGPFTPYYVTRFTLDGDRVLAASKTHPLISEDLGASWTELGVDPFYGVNALLAAGGYYFGTASLGRIIRSGDGGLSWEKVNDGFFGSEGRFFYLHDHVFATTNGKVLVSTNLGDSWQEPSGLPQTATPGISLPVRAMAVTNTTLYAGVDFAGVYSSTDGGLSWTLFSAELPNPHFQELLVYKNALYAACTDGGIWRYDLGLSGIHTASIPASLKIWPNPASDKVTLTMDGLLCTSEKADIAVFDALGRCVVQSTGVTHSGQIILSVTALKPGEYKVFCTSAAGLCLGRFVKI